MSKTPTEDLYEDLGQRIKHAKSLIVFVHTESGNFVLMESTNVTRADLTAAKNGINSAIAERSGR